LKLAIDIGERTASRVMPKGRPPAPATPFFSGPLAVVFRLARIG
jgi:hypothetical protein